MTVLGQADRWWYLSELADTLRTSPSSLQRELALLLSVHIIEARKGRGRVYYRAKKESPMYGSLRELFTSTCQMPQRSLLSSAKRSRTLRTLSTDVSSRREREELYRKVWSKPLQHLATDMVYQMLVSASLAGDSEFHFLDGAIGPNGVPEQQ
jgi:hypothetical protein